MRFEKAEMMATKSSGENFISDCFFFFCFLFSFDFAVAASICRPR